LKRSAPEEITEFWSSEFFNKGYLQFAALEKVISDFRAAGFSILNPERFKILSFKRIRKHKNE
jgi:hypothetical protein